MDLDYDTIKDFIAVSQVASVPLILFTSEESSYHSVADVVAAAKAKPGTVTYASGGVGSSGHLSGELFARKVGIKLVHVPYRGGAQTVQSLLAGGVELMWDTPAPTTHSFVADSKLGALAVMSNKRLSSFPDVPAIGRAWLRQRPRGAGVARRACAQRHAAGDHRYALPRDSAGHGA